MSDPTEIAREARDVIAAARALVHEWDEEGVDGFDREAAVGAEAARAEALRSEKTAPTESAENAATTASDKVEPARMDAGEAGPPEPTPTAEEVQATPPATPTLAPKPAVTPPTASTPIVMPGTLEGVRAELGDCTRCGLHAARTQIVFGDGNADADILFIGEGPGETEDEQGLPFVGKAGALLTQMIEKGMGLSRSDVYICNIVKCRPPRNRTPLANEIAACRPFLDGQIAAVKPKVIVSLGKPATGLLLGRDVAITRIRGTWHEYQGIPLMPTLHPAYVLRQYTPENRRAVWEDLKAALERVETPTS